MKQNNSPSKHELRKAQKQEQKSAKSAKKTYNFTPEIPETPQQLAQYEKAIFAWTAPEYIQHPKSKTWYMIAAIIAVIAVVAASFVGDFTMALAVVVFAAVYYYIHINHPPKEIQIKISRMGIKVGTMIFPFSSIQAFWIIYSPPHIATLNLRVKEHFFSDVIIQLHHEDPAPIREYLCGQVPEWEGKNERLGDMILRLLKL